MDNGLCLHEKHERVVSDGDACVSEISLYEITKFENDDKLWAEACGFIWLAFKHINGQDLSYWTDVHVTPEIKIPMQGVEGVLHWYLHNGCIVSLIMHQGEPKGVLIYQEIFDHLVVIRMYYLNEELRSKGVGFGCLNKLEKVPKHMIFQTSKAIPPKEVLKITEKFRKLLFETDQYMTWEMPWGEE